MRLSNSKVKCYRRCPKQYEYKYVEKLERKRKSLQLTRGDWLHQLLMTHYDGESWRARLDTLSEGYDKLFEEEREELGDLPHDVERMFTGYLAHYKEEDKSIRVVDSEVNEIVNLPNGDEFNFIIDLVVEEADGGLWLWDHKTLGQFMPADFQLLDAQLARYFWAAEELGWKGLRGVMFNELITRAPTLPDVLASGELSQRKNLKCDVYTYYREIKRHGLDPKHYTNMLTLLKSRSHEWWRRTPLPRDRALTQQLVNEMMWSSREMKAAEKRGTFPRSPMKNCTWDCDFLDLCSIELMGGDGEDIRRLRYTTRTPESKETNAQ